MDANGMRVVGTLISQDTLIRKYILSSSTECGSFETSSFLSPALNRHDICVSTMAGCPMGCTICATTHSPTPFERILTPQEIYSQVVIALENRLNTNAETSLRIGFLGNGEPFANLANTISAIYMISRDSSIRVEHYTVSTIGVHPKKVEILADVTKKIRVPIRLQFSLISLNEKVRTRLIPEALQQAVCQPYLDWYAQATHLPVRYNVPLIAGVNNAADHLDQVRRFMSEKPALRYLRLAVFNRFPGAIHEPCSDTEADHIAHWFRSRGVPCDLFWGHRDPEVLASCGQMRATAQSNDRVHAIEDQRSCIPHL